MGRNDSNNNKGGGVSDALSTLKGFVENTLGVVPSKRPSSPPLTDPDVIKAKLATIYPSSSSSSKTLSSGLQSALADTLFDNSGFISLVLLLILFIICTFIVLFYTNPDPSKNAGGGSNIPTAAIVKNIFAILGFLFLITLLCVSFLPSLKDFKTFLSQIINVLYVIFYTIGLILFFGLTPSKFLQLYPNAINVITMLIGVFVFYKAFQQNYVEKFNFTYERIKTLILFFCLIALFIVYYVIDLGGFITKYFGYSLLITILLSIFIFLYLIVIFTFSSGVSQKSGNLLKDFSWFSILGSGSFIAFLIIVTVSIYETGISQKISETQSSDSAGLFSDKVYCMAALLVVLLTSVLWIIVLNIHSFPEIFKTTGTPTQIHSFDFYRRALLVVFGLTIACTIVAWISYNIQHFSGKSSIASIILNVLLILVVLALVYKTVVVQLPFQNARKNAFFNTIVNIIFYIPCIFLSLLEWIKNLATGQPSADASSWLLLLLALFLIVAYLTAPLLYNAIQMQGGQMLISEPANTNESRSLGTYQDLNNKFSYGSDQYDYQYAISFWFFMEAVPPNTNSNSNQYASILDFGGKPNILYNTLENSLLFTMQKKADAKETEPLNTITKTGNDGEKEYTVFYKKEDVLLQKWNNMIVNYNGGTMDIFLNGELVKSIPSIVPYYTLDNLTIGENNGANGGICNVVYYNKPLSSINIYYLYNMIKGLSPPVIQNYYWWNVFTNSIKGGTTG